MTPIIKFNKPFSKLKDQFGNQIHTAMLLQVLTVEMLDITSELRDYDTDFGEYDLPKKGPQLLLIFMKQNGGGQFTTFRNPIPENTSFYQSRVGRWFKVEVNQEAGEK